MKRLQLILLGAVLGVAFAGCRGVVPGTTERFYTEGRVIPRWQTSGLARRACPETGRRPECDLLIIKTGVDPDVAGWSPSNLEAAYNLPSSSKGKGQIVAVVDAYDNPNVASDLAAYRSRFGMAAPKFYKYNQIGQRGHYPKGNYGWGSEIDIDVQ